MARTVLTVEEGTRTTPLENPTANAVDQANGNSFDNSSYRVQLRIANASGGPLTVSVPYQGTADGLTVSDRTYVIPDNETWVVGPFPSSYNTTDNGNLNQCLLDWSTGTSVTCEVIKMSAA